MLLKSESDKVEITADFTLEMVMLLWHSSQVKTEPPSLH